MSGGQPALAEACGWQQRELHNNDAEPYIVWHQRGDCIGWIDANNLYLSLEAAYTVVSDIARKQGKGMAIAAKTLVKRMEERKMLKGVRLEKDHNTVRISVCGQRIRVVPLDASIIGITPQSIEQYSPPQPKLSLEECPF